MANAYYVYILTNPTHSVLYTGFTSNLLRRVMEHRAGIRSRFPSKYNVCKLVYYESFSDPVSAIAREKQIKAGSRKKKLSLIQQMNPEWKDLLEESLSVFMYAVT